MNQECHGESPNMRSMLLLHHRITKMTMC